jgi:hypothetical protein
MQDFTLDFFEEERTELDEKIEETHESIQILDYYRKYFYYIYYELFDSVTNLDIESALETFKEIQESNRNFLEVLIKAKEVFSKNIFER